MLSIGAMAKGQGAYYLNLAQEDYFLKGGEPLGKWYGGGAEFVALPEHVQKADLQQLLAGFGPDGAPLIQNAGKANHQPGWDLTFSAPKSVSVFWSQMDPKTRAIIQKAHEAAVQAALQFIEHQACFSRRGKKGTERDSARLIAATFEHGTSRALDPQLHTHALIVNVSVRPDGTTGTVLSKPFYEHKMAAGALYRTELSHRLTSDLGVVCRTEKSWFEIEGVPESLIQEFSKRREQITQQLKSRNLESASAASLAALSTREPKDIIPPRSELFGKWQEVGSTFGFAAEQVLSFRPQAQGRSKPTFDQVLSEVLTEITRQHNYFTEKELLTAVAGKAQTGAFSAVQIRDGVESALKNPELIVELGKHDAQLQYTTPEVLALERQMLKSASALASRKEHGVSARIANGIEGAYSQVRSTIMAEAKYHARQLSRAAQGRKTRPINRSQILKDTKNKFSREQVKAFRYLTKKGRRNIRILEGLAGTGKSSLLRAVREAYEKAGYRVLGVTLSGKAARELQNASGIRSITIASLEFLMRHPLRHKLSHHMKQILRAAFGGEPMQRFKFDMKTVLIIDEASMVSTQSLAPIIREAERGGGLLILSGDRLQLPAIERGGAFAHLIQRIGAAVLTRIIRQREPRDREIVSDMAEGNVQAALKALAERGLVTVTPDREQAKEQLVKSWSEQQLRTRNKSLIFCATNAEANEVNSLCQETRRKAGELKDRNSIRLKELTCHAGDRIVFLKNSRPLRVNNGDIATITSISPVLRRVTARMDDGRRVVIPLRDYDHLDLGYAVTTHKGQGTTVESAYVLAGGSMQDHSLSYVQLSRARGETRVFIDSQRAGPDLSRLAEQMSRSRRKRLARDISYEPDLTLERRPF